MLQILLRLHTQLNVENFFTVQWISRSKAFHDLAASGCSDILAIFISISMFLLTNKIIKEEERRN